VHLSPPSRRRGARALWWLAAAWAAISIGTALAQAPPSGNDTTPGAAAPAPAQIDSAAPPSGGFPGVGKLPPKTDEKELAAKRDDLLKLLHNIRKREAELAARREDLANPKYESRKDELEQQVRNVSSDLDLLRQRFKELASGVDIETANGKEETEFDWSREVKDLLGPAIDELKRVTTRPREMDRLRREIDVLNEQLHTIQRAQDNLALLGQRFADTDLASPLADLGAEWEARRQEISTDLEYTSNRLDRMKGERRSIASTIEDLVRIFFRSRGKNLLLAIVALVVFWLSFRLLQTWIERVSPFHRRGQTAAIRVFNLTYMLFTGIGAIATFLYVLYLAGDWVLLTVTGLFLVGIAWASKATLPRFWEQTTMLLNLGSVREGERVIFAGLPWRVRTLSIYTHLENPELTGGDIRVPIKSVFGLTSRLFDPAEPWFPTHRGEWVLLEGGPPHAQVILQTPEFVHLRYLGGAERAVPAAVFLSTNPTVLSRGFRLGSVFGVDYRHQPEITGEIPERLGAYVRQGLEKAGFGAHVRKLSIEIQDAAASSINLLVQVDFAGDAAADYLVLSRLLQRLCIEASNAHGWVIPFPQLTVHRGETRDPGKDDVPSAVA